MKIIDTNIPDVKLIEPAIFGDERGFFFESFNRKRFEEAIGRSIDFVQDNHSRSSRGVLRGLHYQLPPFAQGKLVRCTVGKVFDIAVDIRRSSPTFGKAVTAILSESNKEQIWIPQGFAHGFLTMSEYAEIQYKTDNYWNAQYERSILWSDPALAIDWPLQEAPILSAKDQRAVFFSHADMFA